jgi:hypothetical protein
VNVDDSFVPENGGGTTGDVIREAAALLEGARLARDWTTMPIIFESDCSSVVRDADQGKSSRSYLRSHFSEFAFFSSFLKEWKCLFVLLQEQCLPRQSRPSFGL